MAEQYSYIYKYTKKYGNIIIGIAGVFSAFLLHFSAYCTPIPSSMKGFIDAQTFFSISFMIAVSTAVSLFISSLFVEGFLAFVLRSFRVHMQVIGRLANYRSKKSAKRIIKISKYLSVNKNPLRILVFIILFSIMYVGAARSGLMILVFLLYSVLFYLMAVVSQDKNLFIRPRDIFWQIKTDISSGVRIDRMVASVPYLVLLSLFVASISGILRAEMALERDKMMVERSDRSQSGIIFAATSNGFFFFVPKNESEEWSLETYILPSTPEGSMNFISYGTFVLISPIDDA